jgi:hypothetical protein
MPQVLCAVDERPASAEAVRSAVAFCRDHDADLTLVGVVRPMHTVTQPASGELVRRFGEVQMALIKAARAARADGVAAKIVVRSGDQQEALVREAEAVGAEDIFVANGHNRLAAVLRRSPEVSLTRISIPARPAAAQTTLRAVA